MQEKRSIFRMIQEERAQDTVLPYRFQDVYKDGQEEYLFLDNGGLLPSTSMVSSLAKDLLFLLDNQVLVQAHSSFVDLSAFLRKKPFYTYSEVFIDYFSDYIKELDPSQKEKWNHWLIDTVTKAEDYHLVQACLALLPFFKDDLSQKIHRILTLHSRYTFYALQGMKKTMNKNSFRAFLKWVNKYTTAFGHLITFTFLDLDSQEEVEWFLAKGSFNHTYPSLAAQNCLRNASVLNYLNQADFTGNLINSVSYLIVYAFEQEDFAKKYIRQAWILNYVNHIHQIDSFLGVAAMSVLYAEFGNRLITLGMGIDGIYEVSKDSLQFESWQNSKDAMAKLGSQLLKHKKIYQQWLYREMLAPQWNFLSAIAICRYYNLTPDFIYFQPYLIMDPLDVVACSFLVEEHLATYLGDVVQYVMAVVRPTVYNYLEEGPKRRVPKSFALVDHWQLTILTSMTKFGLYHEDYLLLVAKYPNIEVRKLALSLLKEHRNQWGPTVRTVLHYYHSFEPNRLLQHRLSTLVWQGFERMDIRQVSLDPEKIILFPQKTGNQTKE